VALTSIIFKKALVLVSYDANNRLHRFAPSRKNSQKMSKVKQQSIKLTKMVFPPPTSSARKKTEDGTRDTSADVTRADDTRIIPG